jgi:hypothetical protein
LSEDGFRLRRKEIKKASRGSNPPCGDFIGAFSGNPFSSIPPRD